MKKTINVLWTGGLDSTCRVAQLSQMDDIVIQPYYIIDKNRGSVKYEISAMKNITEIIRQHPNTKATLNDVKTIKLEDIEQNPTITQCYTHLRNKYKLGSQYDFLARFANEKKIVLEVGLECSPRSKAYNTITGECKELLEDKNIDVLYINKSLASTSLVSVFENLRFPKKLWSMSKLQEVEFMKSIGLESIILKTHFCHTPVFGLTCGQCNPCKDALNEGMAFRVSKVGRILGLLRKIFYDLPRKVLHKIFKH